MLQAQGWVGDVRDLRFGDLQPDVHWIGFRVSYELTRGSPPTQVVGGSVDLRVDMPEATFRELLPSGDVVYRLVTVVPPSGVGGSPSNTSGFAAGAIRTTAGPPSASRGISDRIASRTRGTGAPSMRMISPVAVSRDTDSAGKFASLTTSVSP